MYVVISIILITVMLAIGLFYPTQLHSFIYGFFEYFPLFIPIDLRYILDKVLGFRVILAMFNHRSVGKFC